MRRMTSVFALIAASAIIIYGCGENMPQEPEVPGGGETEKPIDPELPDDPFEPSDILFENFAGMAVPATYKLYDVDDAVIEPSPDLKYAWLARSGDGIYSYGMLKDKAQVDDWIVTPAIKINNLNSVLSWRMTALFTFVPGQPVKTSPEEYEVYISTEGQELSYFQGKTPAYSTKALKCGSFEQPEINLDKYIGKEIYVAFRHCTQPQNADILWLQNIRVREYPSADLACGGISFAGQPSHTFKVDQNLSVQAIIYNRSLQAVTTFKVRYKYGTQQVEQTFAQTIGRESKTMVTFSTPLVMSNAGESQDISVEVIYDGDQNNTNNATSTQLVCIGAEPHKRVVFEKVTSFGCGPCGATHEVIEHTENANPEKVVGISVHVNEVVGADNTGCESFADAYVAWTGIGNIQQIGGLPAWGTSRRFRGRDIDGSFNKTTAPASIDVDVVYNADDNSFDATIKTVFAADALAEGYYALGLGVLEDGIDAGQYGSSSRTHNNTARELIGGNRGLAGSLPKNVVKGVENSYTFHHQIPAKYGIDTREPKPDNLEVVAFLYDAITGEALNCVKAKVIK